MLSDDIAQLFLSDFLNSREDEYGGTIPPGVHRSIIPSAPDAWLTALERFGTMRFGEIAPNGGGSALPWDADLNRTEFALGYRASRGVLIKAEDHGWRIAQYHLTIPVPNDLAVDLAERIRAHESGSEPGSE